METRKPLDLLPMNDVIEWLQERRANCQRLACLCRHSDVEGWMDDFHWFDSAIQHLTQGEKP
jgi:hypothetical protein